MKKNDFTGWKEVFCFSFLQGVKQKSFVIFLVVMGAFLLLFKPVSTLIRQNGQDKENKSEITDLTVYDETGLNIDYTGALPAERYSGTLVAAGEPGAYERHKKALEESEESTEVIVKITYEDEGYFHLTFVKSAKAALEDKDCRKMAEQFEKFFVKAKMEAVDVHEEQYDFINQPVSSRIMFTSESGEIDIKEGNESISMEEYYILFAGTVIVMMIISFSGSSIAVSVVTEKSTKVVEYLMMNVRPMALIAGKIAAALATILLQFAVMGVCYFLSLFIDMGLTGAAGNQQLPTAQASAFVLDKIPGLQIGNIVIAMVIILIGVLFFGILAGLAGASVSKMEEMAEGMKIYQMFMMAGYFVGIFLCITQMSGSASQTVINICCMVPVAAPFVVPGHLLLGKIGMGTALLSGVLLIVVTVVLFSFTARVYEALIFYNGNVMKFKDIIQIAKVRKNHGGKGESRDEKKHV